MAPSVIVLLLWMIVPLALTLWFSFQRYNLVVPTIRGFAGFENYQYLLTDPALWTAMLNTLYLVGWVLVVTVVLGTLFAVLFDQEFWGRGDRAPAGDRAVLRDAHGQRAGLEEPPDASGERPVRLLCRPVRAAAGRLVRQPAADLDRR